MPPIASHQRFELGIAAFGQHDADMGVEIAVAAGLLGQAAPLETQHLVGARPGGNVDGHLAGRRLDGELGAEHGVLERHRQIGMEVAALDAIARVAAEADLDQRVAGSPKPCSPCPFSRIVWPSST